jgi:hypothetical protein
MLFTVTIRELLKYLANGTKPLENMCERGMIIGQTYERNGKGIWEKRGKEINV